MHAHQIWKFRIFGLVHFASMTIWIIYVHYINVMGMILKMMVGYREVYFKSQTLSIRTD